MPTSPLLHSQATGIHPSAYVGTTAPSNPYSVAGVWYALPDHVLWVDISSGPPYQLKMWDAATPGWLLVGIVSSAVGVDGSGAIATDCLTFPHGAVLCNPSTNLVTLITPDGLHQWDASGYTLPGGHRLESYTP